MNAKRARWIRQLAVAWYQQLPRQVAMRTGWRTIYRRLKKQWSRDKKLDFRKATILRRA